MVCMKYIVTQELKSIIIIENYEYTLAVTLFFLYAPKSLMILRIAGGLQHGFMKYFGRDGRIRSVVVLGGNLLADVEDGAGEARLRAIDERRRAADGVAGAVRADGNPE